MPRPLPHTRLLIPALFLVAAGSCTQADSPSDPGSSPTPTSVRLSPAAVDFDSIGDTVRIVATVLDQFGAPIPGASVGWGSGNDLVATVSRDGLVTAAGYGEGSVSVSAGARVENATAATYLPLQGRFVFASRPVGSPEDSTELYTVNADASDLRRITFNDVPDLAPSWSPDGSRIAFQSTREGQRDIFVIDADGSNEGKLTDSPADDSDPDWSPDGSSVVFQRFELSTGTRLFTVGVDDGTETLLPTSGSATFPTWSPDGARIAYTGLTAGAYQIWVMNADGSGAEPITGTGYLDYFPSWSPDGSRIAWTRAPLSDQGGGGDPAVYVVDSDGANLTRLAPPIDSLASSDVFPTWSPDGDLIAFIGSSILSVMRPDGSGRGSIGGLRAGCCQDWIR
jgi:Tol biopolymer transport system component